VLDGGARSASAVALEASTVVGVAGSAVRRAYRSDPDLAERLLRSLLRWSARPRTNARRWSSTTWRLGWRAGC